MEDRLNRSAKSTQECYRGYPAVLSRAIGSNPWRQMAVQLTIARLCGVTAAITKIIADKDILFSNSPIEEVNRIMKRYLPQMLEEMESVMGTAVADYTEKRPMCHWEDCPALKVYKNYKQVVDFIENQTG